MSGPAGPITLDTNVAIYAYLDRTPKTQIANVVLERAHFVSVQLLNEFTNVAVRKRGLSWPEVSVALADMRLVVPTVLPLEDAAHVEALPIAARYELSYYDALMLAVALSGGARTFYSEDMQHCMIIDGTLRIVDPFRPGAMDA